MRPSEFAFYLLLLAVILHRLPLLLDGSSGCYAYWRENVV